MSLNIVEYKGMIVANKPEATEKLTHNQLWFYVKNFKKESDEELYELTKMWGCQEQYGCKYAQFQDKLNELSKNICVN